MSGGIVEVGQNRVTYTGVEPGGTGSKAAPGIASPTSALIATQIGGSTFPNNAQNYYAFTFVNSAGEETDIGSSLSGLYTNNSGGAVDYSLSSIDTGPTGTVARRVYRTQNGGGGGLKLLTTIANNSSTTFSPDNVADASLGATVPPGSNGTSTPTGSTTLPVEDISQFLAAGGWAAAGNQIIRYTGRSASSGRANLTGIPASGSGSLTAPVPPGAMVKAVAHLTGCSGVTYAINNGDPVNVVVTVNDTTAQTNMAGFVGGDGIHEMFISDGRWSLAEATARANAELAMRKDPITTVTFTSRDPTLQSGRTITITTTNPAVSGTFLIQRVTITQAGVSGPVGYTFPLRQVECSSVRFSLEDLLRQITKR